MRETSRHEGLKFDWTGFVVLSLGLASLQLMLDRGSSKIGFTPRRTIAELVVACLGIYLFIVDLFTTDNPFIPPRIFRAASPFRRPVGANHPNHARAHRRRSS